MSASRWTWSDRTAVPAALLIAEATWLTLSIDATLAHLRIDVGLLAFILPATVVVVGVGLCSRLRRHRLIGYGIAAVSTIVVISFAAGLIGITLAPEHFATLAWHPWQIRGKRLIECAWTAWGAAFAAGVSGFWLGAKPVASRSALALTSVGLGAYVILFIVDTVNPNRALHHATVSMSWSAVLFLACAMAALVAIRRREIESVAREHASMQASTTRDMTGVGIVVVLTAGAVLFATALGFLAPDIAHAVVDATRGLGAAIHWLWSLLPKGSHKATTSLGGTGHGVSSRQPQTPTVPASAHGSNIGIVFGALSLMVLAALIAIALRHRFRVARSRPVLTTNVEEAGESDSVFSWRHLFDQLWNLACSLFSRSKPEIASPLRHDPMPAQDDESVRGQYRLLLVAAARQGLARRGDETSRELELRLGANLANNEAVRDDLSAATRSYERVRYGDRDEDGLASSIKAQVVRVVAALEESAASDSSDGGTPSVNV